MSTLVGALSRRDAHWQRGNLRQTHAQPPKLPISSRRPAGRGRGRCRSPTPGWDGHRVDGPLGSQSALVPMPTDGDVGAFDRELAPDQLRLHPQCRVEWRRLRVPSHEPLTHRSSCSGEPGSRTRCRLGLQRHLALPSGCPWTPEQRRPRQAQTLCDYLDTLVAPNRWHWPRALSLGCRRPPGDPRLPSKPSPQNQSLASGSVARVGARITQLRRRRQSQRLDEMRPPSRMTWQQLLRATPQLYRLPQRPCAPPPPSTSEGPVGPSISHRSLTPCNWTFRRQSACPRGTQVGSHGGADEECF